MLDEELWKDLAAYASPAGCGDFEETLLIQARAETPTGASDFSASAACRLIERINSHRTDARPPHYIVLNPRPMDRVPIARRPLRSRNYTTRSHKNADVEHRLEQDAIFPQSPTFESTEQERTEDTFADSSVFPFNVDFVPFIKDDQHNREEQEKNSDMWRDDEDRYYGGELATKDYELLIARNRSDIVAWLHYAHSVTSS